MRRTLIETSELTDSAVRELALPTILPPTKTWMAVPSVKGLRQRVQANAFHIESLR